MILFEDIISTKEKTIRDQLIKQKLIDLNNNNQKQKVATNSIFYGFITSDSTVWFSNWHYNLDIGLGSYHEMKTEEYFYEFFDFLVEHNLSSKQDVIKSISSFINKYFSQVEEKKYDREATFDNIWKKLEDMYENNPQQFNQYKAKWLDIGVFKNLFAAECTEHACITQNLLSFCDIAACYVS